MWQNRLGVVFFSAALGAYGYGGSLSAAPADSPVVLALLQLVDLDCDGVPDQAVEIPPGACLIYQIDALNPGSNPFNNLEIAGFIPEHTELVTAFERIDGAAVDSFVEQTVAGNRLLKTRLPALQPGMDHKVSIRYRVRVL